MYTFFPRFISNRAIALYFIALISVSLIFIQYSLNWLWILFGIAAVVPFFYYSNALTKRWGNLSTKTFIKKIFWVGFIVRICYVIFSYFFYIYMVGAEQDGIVYSFQFGVGDAAAYHFAAEKIAAGFRVGTLDAWNDWYQHNGLSDSGYPTYLSVVYLLTGDSMLIARLIKALISAYTAILMYKLSVRNFGESTGRMTAIFCMLMPHFIYYCGLHLKETEMVFLSVLFIERVDYILRGKKMSVLQTILTVLIGLLLFSFRTVLGGVAFAALFSALVFSSKRVMSWGKKIMMGVIVIFVISLALSDQITREVSSVWGQRYNSQTDSMQSRAISKGGNRFAEYASATIFAPFIFTIPFPTIVETPGQQNMKMMNGANYVKNITSAFTIFALVLLIIRGNWRKHLPSLVFMVGYLIVIAFSAFAQSERFHLPALPFALMFAAYGVSQFKNKHKRLFNLWLVFIYIAIIGWSWFKLAGRGMV